MKMRALHIVRLGEAKMEIHLKIIYKVFPSKVSNYLSKELDNIS